LAVYGVVTRIGSLTSDTLYQDDAWIALASKASGFQDIRRVGMTAPGFGFSLRAWLGAVGFSSEHARLLPFALGILLAPLVFVVARLMGQRLVAALLGATVLVTSPALATYSLRAKQYAGEAVLATVLIGLGWLVVQSPRSWRRWVALTAVAIAAGLFSFPLVLVAAGGFVAGTVARLLDDGWRSLWRAPALAMGLVFGLACLVEYRVFVVPATTSSLDFFWREYSPTYGYGPELYRTTDWKDLGLVGNLLRLLASLFDKAFVGRGGLWLAGFAVASVVVAWRRPRAVLLVGVPVLLAIAGSFAHKVPIGGGRTDIYLYVPLTFMFLFAVDEVVGRTERTRARAPSLVASGVVLLLVAVLVLRPPTPEVGQPVIDDEPLIAMINEQGAPGDLVVLDRGHQYLFALYTDRPFTTQADPSTLTGFVPVIANVEASLPPASDPVYADADSVWLLTSQGLLRSLPADRSVLTQQGYRLIGQYSRVGAGLEHWKRG
jgi:hypothetical protein